MRQTRFVGMGAAKMGFLNGLFGRKKAEAAFIRAAIRRYGSDVEELLRDPAPARAAEMRLLHCLLVQVRDDTLEQVQLQDAQAIPIYAKRHGVILHLMGSVHFVTFGVFDDTKGADLTNFRAAIAELRTIFAGNVRIVAFSGEMLVGNFGTSDHMSYTAVAPKFDRFLKALVNTEFGQVVEMSV